MQFIVKVDIHVTNETNKFWEVAYVIKVRQLLVNIKSEKLFCRLDGGRYKQEKM